MTALKAVPLKAPGQWAGQSAQHTPASAAATRTIRHAHAQQVPCAMLAPNCQQHCATMFGAVPVIQHSTQPSPGAAVCAASPCCCCPWCVVCAGVWAEQRADDGRRYYWNKFTNTSKWSLTEDEKTRLVSSLDSYDNPMVMPLQVNLPEPGTASCSPCRCCYHDGLSGGHSSMRTSSFDTQRGTVWFDEGFVCCVLCVVLLQDFINHPIAAELLHNGELLQVRQPGRCFSSQLIQNSSACQFSSMGDLPQQALQATAIKADTSTCQDEVV